MNRSWPRTVNSSRKSVAIFFLLCSLLPGARAIASGNNPCQIDPTKGFLANFSTPCYALPLIESNGSNGQSGDLNALYDQVYYQVQPGYDLILVGVFPNARYMSAQAYDSHETTTSELVDTNILPLTSRMVNPYNPGVSYQPQQFYGITVSFGSTAVVTPTAGCSTEGTTIDQNILDASQIHQGMSWNGYVPPLPGLPGLPPGFDAHESGPNSAGILMVRRYVDISNTPQPKVIVRQLSTGCAIPIKQAIAQNIVTTNANVGSNWLNWEQINDHTTFVSDVTPLWCFPPDPINQLAWTRTSQWATLFNSDSAYLIAPLAPATVSSVISNHQFIRMQFQLPTTPPTPCSTEPCSRTGQEQMRYFDLTIGDNGHPIASIKDSDMIKDALGNVTLILGMGTPPPAYVTAANGYTFVDLSQYPNYAAMSGIGMRNILPNQSLFNCSAANVPYQTSEYNPEGGYMGAYVPTVDFPTAAQIPEQPVAPARSNSCGITPSEQPTPCVYGQPQLWPVVRSTK